MAILGSSALLFALILALVNLSIGTIALRQLATNTRGRFSPEQLLRIARRAGLIGFVAVSIAVFTLIYAVFANDYSLANVVHESNRALPAPYKVAALWSGQEGSLLLWAWLLTAYTFVLRLRHTIDEQLIAFASTILAAIEVFFLLLLNFAALPFAQVTGPVPADGFGMNPLLQYPEMVIHPPLLYLGYVGVSVPFSLALAALILRRPGEKWLPMARRWTMVNWIFLTAGIVLGMHWAYAVLGWGGYWGWDPVENASLMPWLTGTAFLHSTFMQRRRGMMKSWNLWLIFLTFMLSILGTLLTRSGIVSSVHAFGESSIGDWFSMFLGIVLLVCALAFVARRDHLRPEREIEGVISRDAGVLFGVLVLLAGCAVVFLGTLLPVFSALMNGSKITVGPDFYNRVVTPIGLFLLLLTGVTPLLPSRINSFATLAKNFAFPCFAGVVTALLLIAFGIHPLTNQGTLYSWLCFSLAAFMATAIGTEFLRGARLSQHQSGNSLPAAMQQHFVTNARRHGAYIVHFGIVLMFVGFAGSAFNQSFEKELDGGQHMDIGPYRLVSQGYTQESNDNYAVERSFIDTYQDGRLKFQLAPEARLYPTSQNVQTVVANHSTLLRDLYVVYEGRDPDSGRPEIKAFLNPLVLWIWIGTVFILIGAIVSLLPQRRFDLPPSPLGDGESRDFQCCQATEPATSANTACLTS